ncbi:MAG: efflux RND transporter periplasmic adaptor subunit, partial [Terriglobia bacterium]
MTDPELTEPHRPASTTRLVVIAIFVLIIVAIIVVAGIVPRERAKAALRNETNELAVPTVAVIQAKRGSPQQELVLPGNMQPFIESPIYARTNGYLKKWTHDIGAHVKTGELLAEIETPEVDAQLEQARSDLNTAIANMKLAQVTAERYEGLRNTDAVSKQDVDTAASDYTARKAMVASAEGSVKRYEQLQSFEKVYAPFDGVITARHTDVGYLINSGNAGPAQELFRIAAIQKLRVFVN